MWQSPEYEQAAIILVWTKATVLSFPFDLP